MPFLLQADHRLAGNNLIDSETRHTLFFFSTSHPILSNNVPMVSLPGDFYLLFPVIWSIEFGELCFLDDKTMN
jgi:hypothetical protein